MKRLFRVIKEIHSENGKWSSKRVYGGLMIIVVCACALMGKEHTVLEPMIYSAVGMIGFGTAVRIAEAIKGKKDETTNN